MEEVFEPVRDLCQQHGIAFEVVDLRWGKNANSAKTNAMAFWVSNIPALWLPVDLLDDTK